LSYVLATLAIQALLFFGIYQLHKIRASYLGLLFGAPS